MNESRIGGGQELAGRTGVTDRLRTTKGEKQNNRQSNNETTLRLLRLAGLVGLVVL